MITENLFQISFSLTWVSYLRRITTNSAFSTETKAWSQVTATGTIPSPRFSHGAAIYKEIMWVFGGSNKSSTLDDLYSFNTGTWFSSR